MLLSRNFLGICCLVFFWNSACWGVVHDSQIFWKYFCPQNGENRLSLGSIMKVYINCCMLGQISYLKKFGFLRYEPKCWKRLIFCMLIEIHWNHVHKWVCPLWSQESKISWISRRYQWNKLDFDKLIWIQESLKLL